MILSKADTYKLLVNFEREKSINQKYTFTTKYAWKCLHCMQIIYVSYRQYGRNSIFCNPCYIKTALVETVVQYQYMRILKENQMELMESMQSTETPTL